MPDATVLIAAWNASDTLTSAVESARSQIDVDLEIVVADDCSDDGTFEIAENNGARAYRLSLNGGPAAARNLALDNADAPWIAVLDADDRMAPVRLSRMISLAEDMDADVVLGNFRTVDSRGNALTTSPFLHGAGYEQPEIWSLQHYVRGNFGEMGVGPYGYLKPVFRQTFLKENALRYDTRLRNGEDCHMIFSCLAAGGRVVFAPWDDYLYTVQEGSISHVAMPAHIAALIVADDEFVARHEQFLTRKERALFALRRKELVRLRDSETVLQALKAKRPDRAIAELVRHPAAASRVVRQLLEAGRKRLKAT